MARKIGNHVLMIGCLLLAGCADVKLTGLPELATVPEVKPRIVYVADLTLADIVVYDLNKLAIKPMEVVHDFPGGEWRRVQQAEGFHAITVNGEVTFEDGRCTNATPGRVLRHGS